MRQTGSRLVEDIAPCDSAEVKHQLDVLRWIDGGGELFRTAKPATATKHLVYYCLLAYIEARQVLLIDHRDAQRWLPTGGHIQIDEDHGHTATTEIFEELQVSPKFHATIGPKPLMVSVKRTQGVLSLTPM